MAASDQHHGVGNGPMDGDGQLLAATAPANDAGTHTLQLSLFLMLLTFFFVLTSGSSFDEQRVGPVIGGIQDAFGALTSGAVDQVGPRSGGALPVLQNGLQPASGDFSDAVNAAFHSVGGQESVQRGGTLDLALDVSALFVDGAAAIRADKRMLFSALGAALAGEANNRHVAILVPAASQNRLDVRRAASVARLLAAAGTPEGHLAVGVTDIPRDFVSFRFFTLPKRPS